MDKEDVIHLQNEISLSHKKEKTVMSFAATWMNLEIVIMNEVSQRRRNIYDIAYMWNL